MSYVRHNLKCSYTKYTRGYESRIRTDKVPHLHRVKLKKKRDVSLIRVYFWITNSFRVRRCQFRKLCFCKEHLFNFIDCRKAHFNLFWYIRFEPSVLLSSLLSIPVQQTSGLTSCSNFRPSLIIYVKRFGHRLYQNVSFILNRILLFHFWT